MRLLSTPLLLTASLILGAALSTNARSSDLVAKPDGIDRASMQSMQIPSHGALMNALVYVAAGAGPHPAVILLHGFPGNERNLDLAQEMRRAGWDVLYFNYRGSWGTPGDFSFTHGIEDTAAAIAYLRQPEVAKVLRLDPTSIVLIGHSMGGFMAVQAVASDPAIKAFATISAADLGGMYDHLRANEAESTAIKNWLQASSKRAWHHWPAALPADWPVTLPATPPTGASRPRSTL